MRVIDDLTTESQSPAGSGFDTAPVLDAVRHLEGALAADDPLAWVDEYTDDAVFDGGGEHPVQGRDALLAMAGAMRPLSSVSIRPLRVEGCGDLAVTWCAASWVSGGPQDAPQRVEVRGLLCWRRDVDGIWRVAMEQLG